jgi:hypothetical protein
MKQTPLGIEEPVFTALLLQALDRTPGRTRASSGERRRLTRNAVTVLQFAALSLRAVSSLGRATPTQPPLGNSGNRVKPGVSAARVLNAGECVFLQRALAVLFNYKDLNNLSALRA